MPTTRLGIVLSVLLAGGLLALRPAGARAQAAGDARLEQARRLEADSRFGEAEARIREYLRDHPGDASALRLLATILESQGDFVGARVAYEQALRARPGDPLLRLDLGRVLVEGDDTAAARVMLEPLATGRGIPGDVRADALVELGRVALEAGDSAKAELRFRGALKEDPQQPDALDGLRALAREDAPWVRADAGLESDNQPLRDYRGALEGGVRLYPWLATELQAGVQRGVAGSVHETLTSAEAILRFRVGLLHLQGSLRGGGFRRTLVDRGDWSGGGSLALHGPAGLVLEAETEREPYLLTAASLSLPLTVTSAGGTLGRPGATGWAGALSYRKDRFDDGNTVEEASAWFLAPVVRRPAGTVRVGYRFHAANADETDFVPVSPRTLEPGGALVGRYDPLYTPRELRSQTAMVEVRHREESGTELILDASWGFDAQEDGPVLYPAVPGVPDAGTDLQLHRHHFTPWNLEARLRLPLTPALVLQASGGYRSTAFRGRSYLETRWTFYDLPADLR